MNPTTRTNRPSYRKLHESGELERRVEVALKGLSSCRLCARRCGVDRLAGQVGFCGAGRVAEVSSWNDHHGEEPCISGYAGSGTIFFTRCVLKCIFCQNYPISQLGNGRPYTAEELAKAMLSLKRRACHNINLVTPTHYVPQFLEALRIACAGGLDLPIVYNTNGYDSLETLALLDGIVDVYLPDLKYADPQVAEELSGRADYVEVARTAITEMNRQVGRLTLNEEGIAERGLLVRHLVLPKGKSGTPEVLKILKSIDPEIHISLMSQYFPAHTAANDPVMGRRITAEEYDEALAAMDVLGLENGYRQVE